MDFFASAFWRWFTIQRILFSSSPCSRRPNKYFFLGPILDGDEFPARFASHSNGTQRLSKEGALISMLLVTWAASYGLNQRGLHETECEESPRIDCLGGEPSTDHYPPDGKYAPPGTSRRQWKNQSEAYLREILEFVDLYGILRRPSLDGVRVLLLLLPLMEGKSTFSLFVCKII